MLQPETVNRDGYGEWTHSALTELFGDREIIPKSEWKEWCADHNIEISISEMEYELDEQHPAWIRHFDEGDPGSIGWDPEPPGREWHMLSIHDTEDGPVVIWYREIPPASSAHNHQHREAKSMSDYCLYPSQCGIGMDCSECQSAEIIRLHKQLEQAQARVAELESQQSVMQLSELMRGLEIGPGLATMPPYIFYVTGKHIAEQAKEASDSAILRKQADAINLLIRSLRSDNAPSETRDHLLNSMKLRVNSLRQQANELEQPQ